MSGDLDFNDTNGITNLNSAYGRAGQQLNFVSDGDYQFINSTGTDVFRINDGGNVNSPNGQLSEKGNRVATRTWTNTNFYDTSESDSRYVNDSGDTMSGPLTLGGDLTAPDGETIWDESAGHIPESRLQHNSVTVNSGNALTGGGTLTLNDSLTLGVDETVINHGSLIGLTGTDHHTQYMHVDGRRGFTNPVEGANPSKQTHLATKDYVDSTAQGLEYKESVLDELNTPPSSPSSGDRYLVGTSPSGDFSGHSNELAEYDGSSWTFNAANEGWSVFIEDIDKLKTWNSSSWVQFGSTISHDVLQGLGDDDHTQYLHRDGRRSMNGKLDMSGNDLNNVSHIEMDGNIAGSGVDIKINEVKQVTGPINGATNLDIQTQGDGTHSIRLRDGYNGTDKLVVNEGGSIDVFANLTDSSGNTIYDQSNNYVPQARIQQGSGSGLDADKLDGNQKSDLDNQYVDESGDTMSGGLTVNGSVDISQFLELEPVSEPSVPSTGKRVFVDSADGGLKVKDASGTVVTIAE